MRRVFYALAVGLVSAAAAQTAAQTAPPKRAAPHARRGAQGAPPARPVEKGAAFYSCPMHPEFRSRKKGRCPKCGMELRPALGEAVSTGPGSRGSHAAGESSTGAAAGGPTKLRIPDVELLDQEGRTVHFYSDLVKGKVVAVNFIFTTCTTICPPLGATFARVQMELGARAGRDVHLISVSVDPETDTPERLKAWGDKFRAGAGWTFVTGAKPQVDELLRALAASTARREDHTPTVLIGNDALGQWTRAYGLSRPAMLVGLIDDAAAGRLDPSNAKESTRQ